jgi:hypothetical protein
MASSPAPIQAPIAGSDGRVSQVWVRWLNEVGSQSNDVVSAYLEFGGLSSSDLSSILDYIGGLSSGDI